MQNGGTVPAGAGARLCAVFQGHPWVVSYPHFSYRLLVREPPNALSCRYLSRAFPGSIKRSRKMGAALVHDQSDSTTLINEDSTRIDVYLPQTLDSWPWPRRVNPHYASVKQQASLWCESFQPFSPKAQNAFNKCDFGLLAALAYPDLDRAGYRVCCDMMNLFFCIDEITDLSPSDAVRSQVDIVMDAIRHPHRPRPFGEWVIGEMARQFWANAALIASPTAQARFIDSCQTYLDALVQQAEDREKGHIRLVEDYFTVRRGSIGAAPSITIGALYLNIPQEAFDHPVISKLTEICVDMIIIGNDICSYKVEWERGDEGHNLVTVIMQQFRVDVQHAMHHIANLHDCLFNRFLEHWRRIPLFGGPVDSEIRTYCNMLANWVRANDSWSFESERYFGTRGPKVQTTRLVYLSGSKREARLVSDNAVAPRRDK